MYRTPIPVTAALTAGLALAGAPVISGTGPMELGPAADGLQVAGRYAGRPGYRGPRPRTGMRGQTDLSVMEPVGEGRVVKDREPKRRPVRHGPPGKGYVRY